MFDVEGRTLSIQEKTKLSLCHKSHKSRMLTPIDPRSRLRTEPPRYKGQGAPGDLNTYINI